MKNIIIFIMVCMMTNICVGQNNTKEELREKVTNLADSLSEEGKDAMYSILETMALIVVDSAVNEGRYMQALELMDSLKINWKYITGKDLPPRIYLTKSNILMHLEEWEELIKNVEECLTIYEDSLDDKIAAIMSDMSGTAHRSIEKYRTAINIYEKTLYYYKKTGEIGNQGNTLCNIAFCYSKLNKHTMASSYYKKGMDKFLEYFGTTRHILLRSNFNVESQRKKALLAVFACHLYDIAVYEQDNGNRLDSKDYLLMSAHCGNAVAKSEYKRIYGYR